MVIELAIVIFALWQLYRQMQDDPYQFSTWFFRKQMRNLQVRLQGLRYARYAGRCLKCDYDLLHNQSGICPECGTPVAQNRCPRV